MSKELVQSATIRTNATKDSVCKVNVEPLKFADLWKSYPSSPPYVDPKTGKPPKGYEDQCAIKVSVAIHGAGVAMKSFTEANVPKTKGAERLGRILLNGKATATRADELAAWLKLQPFCGLPQKPITIAGKDWQDKIKGKTGIVFFADYWVRDNDQGTNATGDHIDLWNKSTMTSSGLRGAATSFARFTLGFPSLWYSDLGEAKEILFWEIK